MAFGRQGRGECCRWPVEMINGFTRPRAAPHPLPRLLRGDVTDVSHSGKGRLSSCHYDSPI